MSLIHGDNFATTTSTR